MKWTKILSYLLFAISIVFAAIFFFSDPEVMTMPFLAWAGVLLAIAVALVIILPLLGVFQNKAALKKLAFLLVGAIVICVACYFLASPELPSQTVLDRVGGNITGATMRWTETGLYVTYLLFVVAIGSLVGFSIYNSIKNR